LTAPELRQVRRREKDLQLSLKPKNDFLCPNQLVIQVSYGWGQVPANSDIKS
jgi:hypothetical protein